MSIEIFIYLIGLLDSLGDFLFFTVFILGMGLLFGFIVVGPEPLFSKDDEALLITKWFKRGIAAFVCLVLVNVFLPTSKTATMMAAAHFGKEALQTETAQKMKKILDLKLDEVIKDLQPEKEKS